MDNPFILGGIAFLFFGFLYNSNASIKLEDPPSSLLQGSTIVYFGADNCGACRRFERKNEDKLETRAVNADIRYVRHVTGSIRSLNRKDVFDNYTSVYQAAISKTGSMAVPTFVHIKDGYLIEAKAGSWRGVLKSAKELK